MRFQKRFKTGSEEACLVAKGKSFRSFGAATATATDVHRTVLIIRTLKIVYHQANLVEEINITKENTRWDFLFIVISSVC